MNEKKEKLLRELRAIVRNKRLMFPTEYISKRMPKIGIGERGVFGVSKKYVFVNCWAEPCFDGHSEYGTAIKKYPVCYYKGQGKSVDKVALDDMFTADIEKLLEEVKFFIWLQAKVELPKVEAKLKELRAYKMMYDVICPLMPIDGYKI